MGASMHSVTMTSAERAGEFTDTLLRLERAEPTAYERYMSAARAKAKAKALPALRIAWVEADRALAECRRAKLISEVEST